MTSFQLGASIFTAVYGLGFAVTAVVSCRGPGGKEEVTMRILKDSLELALLWPIIICIALHEKWEQGNFVVPNYLFQVCRFMYATWPVYLVVVVLSILMILAFHW